MGCFNGELVLEFKGLVLRRSVDLPWAYSDFLLDAYDLSGESPFFSSS